MAVLPARASPVRGRFRLELADSANRPNGHPTRTEATPSLMHFVDNEVGRRCRAERFQTKIRVVSQFECKQATPSFRGRPHGSGLRPVRGQAPDGTRNPEITRTCNILVCVLVLDSGFAALRQA